MATTLPADSSMTGSPGEEAGDTVSRQNAHFAANEGEVRMARAADGELAADAAIGDTMAYASLYHRHIVAAWRLAQATAPSADAAAKATTKAFVRVVRLVGRGREDIAEQFRQHLLAAVYREARSGSDQDRPSAERALAASEGSAQMVEAFRRLPARWRAALWLQEVEQLPATIAGPILGVSSAAAVQLKKRALAGLEYRVAQAGGSLPRPDVASTLAATAPPLPGEVQAKTESRWKRAVASDRHRGGPDAGWARQRAPRPLAACAAGLCVLGLVGLAVVNPKHTVGQIAGPTTPTTVAAAGAGAPAPPPAAPSTTVATAQGTETAQGTHLVAAQPAAVVVATTVAPTLTPATVPVVTVPTVLTVATLPPLTTVPTTPPTTNPPPVATPPPAAQTTPLVQVSLNTGVVGVGVGLGPNACTGVNLLGIKIGCTTAPPGLFLGGTLLGGH